ncbi:MAG: response regulator [Myxococcales bacterium]|nr:response regulator [Myxococcales bacterium]
MEIPLAISPLALGDAAIAGAALVLTTYEAWLYARRRQNPEHLWIAAICASAVAYAGLMAIHYSVGQEAAVILSRLEGAALATASCAALAWALVLGSAASVKNIRLLLITWGVLTTLVLSPWVITSTYPVEPFLGHSLFWRRIQTPLVAAFQATGLVLVVAGLFVSMRAPPERRSAARHFQVGAGLWGAAGLYAAASGLFHRAPSFSVIEYGFCAFAVSLVAHDVRRFMLALASSERAADTAEQKHRVLEALHRDVVASVGDGVVLLDADGCVRLWNPTLVRLTGVTEASALARPLWDVLGLDDPDRRLAQQGLDAAMRGETFTTAPIAIGNGQHRVSTVWTVAPFDSDSTRGAIAVLHDVTAVEDARAAVVKSERNLKALIESLPDAIAVLSGPKILYINAALSTLLGLEPAESLGGLSASRLVHAADRQRLQELEANGPTVQLRLNARHRTLVAEVQKVAIEFDGAPAEALLARDVTERNDVTARMMELDRMVAVGTLAAGVGHEINNPLAYVAANLEELRFKLRPPTQVDAETRSLVEDSLKGTKRIRDIVQAISAFSRSGAERHSTSLAEAVQSAVAMAGNEIRHRARLELDHRGELYVVANEAELAQVILNLLVNASQAVRDGGPESNRIHVRTFGRDGRAICEVTDTGIGMSPEVVARIFDPFFTTKPVGEGTGLGLSICRQTLRALGGEIEVESQPGVGSTFRMVLPVSEAVTEPIRLVKTPSEPMTRRLRVMLVDDESDLVRALARPLRREFELTECASADDALEHLARSADYDVIVTDLMMPGKSGMDLYALINENYPRLAPRVLFTTGGAFTAEAKTFCAEMAGRVLSKPVVAAELRHRIADVAARATADEAKLSSADTGTGEPGRV